MINKVIMVVKEIMDDYNISPRFKKLLIILSILALLVIIGLCLIVCMPGLNDNYLIINHKEVRLDKYPQANRLSLTPTTVNINDNHCMVYAKVYDNTTDIHRYTVKSDYYDENGVFMETSSVKLKDTMQKDNIVLLSDYKSDKIISSVEIRVFDERNNQVYYTVIGESA